MEAGERGVMQQYEWFMPLAQKLIGFAVLKENWDSYGARQVSALAIGEMLGVLLSILEPESPVPEVTPTVQGGVQAEWPQSDLVLEVDGSGRVDVFANNEETAYRLEEANLPTLRRLIRGEEGEG